jgi:hypothetical protein
VATIELAGHVALAGNETVFAVTNSKTFEKLMLSCEDVDGILTSISMCRTIEATSPAAVVSGIHFWLFES